MVSLDKVLTESTRQNDKEHEELFERVWFLEDESHKSLATRMAEWGARVKREGDQVMESLQRGVDRAFDRLDQNNFAHEEKISEKVHDVQAELPISWLA